LYPKTKTKTKTLSYRCNFCNRLFRSNSALNQHVRDATGHRHTFSCQLATGYSKTRTHSTSTFVTLPHINNHSIVDTLPSLTFHSWSLMMVFLDALLNLYSLPLIFYVSTIRSSKMSLPLHCEGIFAQCRASAFSKTYLETLFGPNNNLCRYIISRIQSLIFHRSARNYRTLINFQQWYAFLRSSTN